MNERDKRTEKRARGDRRRATVSRECTISDAPSYSGTRTTSIRSVVSSGRRSKRAAAVDEIKEEERSGGLEGERGASSLLNEGGVDDCCGSPCCNWRREEERPAARRGGRERERGEDGRRKAAVEGRRRTPIKTYGARFGLFRFLERKGMCSCGWWCLASGLLMKDKGKGEGRFTLEHIIVRSEEKNECKCGLFGKYAFFCL